MNQTKVLNNESKIKQNDQEILHTLQEGNLTHKSNVNTLQQQEQSNTSTVFFPIVLITMIFLGLRLYMKNRGIISLRQRFIGYINLKYLMKNGKDNNKKDNELFGKEHCAEEIKQHKETSDKKYQLQCVFKWMERSKHENHAGNLDLLLKMVTNVSLGAGGIFTYGWFASYDGTNPVGLWSVLFFSLAPLLMSIIALGITISWSVRTPRKQWKYTNPFFYIGFVKSFFLFILAIIPSALEKRIILFWHHFLNDEKYNNIRKITKSYTEILDKNDLKNWLTFSQANKIATLFGLGSMVGLILAVAQGDFAVAWCSSLVSNTAWHTLFETVATPWSWLWDDAVPTLEMINGGHYSRLGGEGLSSISQNASLLVNWWKFIFMSILFYGVVLRSMILIYSVRKFGVILDQSIIDDTERLWRQMSSPSGFDLRQKTTTDHTMNKDIGSKSIAKNKIEIQICEKNTPVIGWEIDSNDLLNYCNNIGMACGDILNEETEKCVFHKSLKGDVFFFTWASSIPTGDVLDILSSLSELSTIDGIEVILIPNDGYEDVPTSATTMWEETINQLDKTNIKVKK